MSVDFFFFRPAEMTDYLTSAGFAVEEVIERDPYPPSFDPDDLVGKTFSITQGYDDDAEEYLTNFYYVEHETIDNNEIVMMGRDGERFQVQITGTVTDVNYYDGSKPATQVVIQASFSLSMSAEPIAPVG